MDTNLSIEQIHLALRNCGLWNKRSDIMIPNLSWGLLEYEADFVVISKTGYMTEVEIKRSLADFKADFHKSHTQDAEQVYYFYYCVPENIYDKAIEFLHHCKLGDCNADYPAVLYYTETGQIVNTGLGNKYSKGKHRKLFIEEILQVATAAMQGLLGNPKIINGCGGLEYNHEYITKHAVMYADTLIAELNMKGGGENG